MQEIKDGAYTLRIPYAPVDKNRTTKGTWRKGGVAWNKGRKWEDIYSEETQKKLRAHLKKINAVGREKRGCAHPRPVIQMDENGERLHWYESSAAAARKLGIQERNIRAVCYGKRKRCGGFRWKFDEHFL